MKRLNLLVIFVFFFSCTWSQAQTTADEELSAYRETVIEPAIRGIYERYCAQLSPSERQELEALRDKLVQIRQEKDKLREEERFLSEQYSSKAIALMEKEFLLKAQLEAFLAKQSEAFEQAVMEYQEQFALWSAAQKAICLSHFSPEDEDYYLASLYGLSLSEYMPCTILSIEEYVVLEVFVPHSYSPF